MSNLLTIFLFIVAAIALAIVSTAAIAWHNENVDIDSQYIDANGDHIYYDRSLIEKKLFSQRFPHVSNLRTLSRLFSLES